MEANHKHERIAAMINHTQRGKMPADATPEDWRRFNAAFARQELTAHDLAAEIWRGFAFAPVYGGGRRVKANFEAAWHIALDLDTGDGRSSLQALAGDEFADWFASFAYTTPSHTAAAPRARLVFVFPHDDPITDIAEYETLYRALLWRYPAADQATKDAVRLFYGSPECEVWGNWSIFPGPARQVAIDQYLEHIAATAPPLPAVQITGGDYHRYAAKALERGADRIAQATTGERHKALWAAGLLLGELAAADWSGLAPGDVQTERGKLTAAATWATGPGAFEEVERTLSDAFERGKLTPRPAPARAVPHVRDLMVHHEF
jgi:hypothetical protein